MPAAFSLAPASEDDLTRVQALARRIWPECFAGILAPDEISRILDTVYALDTLIADMRERGHAFWIGRQASRDVAYCAAYMQDGVLWVKKLYVEQSCRGLGIGQALMAAASRLHPHATSLRLLVNENNHAARAFYRSQGFVEQHRIPVLMGPMAFHDYVMSKPASPGEA